MYDVDAELDKLIQERLEKNKKALSEKEKESDYEKEGWSKLTCKIPQYDDFLFSNKDAERLKNFVHSNKETIINQADGNKLYGILRYSNKQLINRITQNVLKIIEKFKHTDKEKITINDIDEPFREMLIEAGIFNADGELAEPYRNN